MKILIFAGHSTNGYKGSGAVGILNESNENRRLGKKVAEYLKEMGVQADFACVDKPKTSSYLKEQVTLANSMGTYDCMVQIHFNAGGGSGTETYYLSNKGKEFANRVNTKLSTKFKNRGIKYSSGLYWLKNTKCPSILIETCFVDTKEDAQIYNNNFNEIAKLIAEGLANKKYEQKVEQPKQENPEYKQYLARCNTDGLNCRKGAGTSYAIDRVINKGTVVTIVGEVMNGNTKWLKTKSGYFVSAKYMDFVRYA